MNSKLFSGQPNVFGGLSNEAELVKLCPEEFKDRHNKWSDYASKVFFLGADISNWNWKTGEVDIRLKQKRCFYGLLRGWNLKHEHKEAVAGWMLSEMLTEVPEHLPCKKGGE